MKKKLFGVLLAFVAVAAMAGGAFAKASGDITFDITKNKGVTVASQTSWDVVYTEATRSLDVIFKVTPTIQMSHDNHTFAKDMVAASLDTNLGAGTVTISVDKTVDSIVVKEATGLSSDIPAPGHLFGLMYKSVIVASNDTDKGVKVYTASNDDWSYLVITTSADATSEHFSYYSVALKLVINADEENASEEESSEGESSEEEPETSEVEPGTSSEEEPGVEEMNSEEAAAFDELFPDETLVEETVVDADNIKEAVEEAITTAITAGNLEELLPNAMDLEDYDPVGWDVDAGPAVSFTATGRAWFKPEFSGGMTKVFSAAKRRRPQFFLFLKKDASDETFSVVKAVKIASDGEDKYYINGYAEEDEFPNDGTTVDDFLESTTTTVSNIYAAPVVEEAGTYYTAVATATVKASGGSDPDPSRNDSRGIYNNSGSSSGCDMGIGGVALLLAALLPLGGKLRKK